MPDPHTLPFHQDAHDVEPIAIHGPSVPVDPDAGRAHELALLAPVDRFDRIPEFPPGPRLDLHERDGALALDDEVDVPVSVPEPAVDDPPPLAPKPSFGDAFAELPECLRGR